MSPILGGVIGGVIGWMLCWYAGGKVSKHVIRRPSGATFIRIVATLRQDTLLALRDAVDAELAKRRMS